ncbi:hypothetical protein ACMGE5_00390 [Macrococcus equi]|uniref:hypothetical protein n=1 Tax=Macrococcus equi TaxID=3395462 RepID=UPI0039BE80C9
MKKLIAVMLGSILLVACSNEVSNEGSSKIIDNNKVDSKTTEKKQDTASLESNTSEVPSTENQSNQKVTHSNNQQNNKEVKNQSKENEVSSRQYTLDEQDAMIDEFYNWAAPRARTANMALSKTYFSHGAAGRGDWYADTPDGEVQTQDNNNPGFHGFNIHSLGGVVFYTRKDGQTGDKDLDETVTAYGYREEMKPDTKIHKYMLADNGTVYELIVPYEDATFSVGFGEYDDNGKRGEYAPGQTFIVSQDQAAQMKWKEILAKYQ